MASKHLANTQQNFTRLVIVCVDLIKLVLKDILSSQIRPADLNNAIASCPELTSGRDKLKKEQKRLCFITAPDVPDYDTFDVTLLYTLIRNLCPSLKPTQGWGKTPSHKAIQIGDDIERLRIFRNEVHGHCKSSHVEDTEFVSRWGNIKTAIKRMEKMLCSQGFQVNYEKELEKISNLKLGPEEMEKFKLLLEAMMYISKKEENEGDPEIWIKGENKVTCGGETCFRVDVESSSVHISWSLTWQRIKGKTTEEIDTTVEKYNGSNDRQLVIHEVSKEDEGEYQAVLSKQNRKRTSNALYLVATGDKPDLHILKVSIEVEGITLNYDYTITSNSPNVHDIAWTKNGYNVDINHSKYVGGGIEDRTLTITSPTTEDSGEYTCTVTNAVGAVSKFLTLGIPSATISYEIPIYVGNTTKISSEVEACPPPEKATWQKSSDSVIFEDINMDDSRYAGSERNSSTPVLVIAKASSDDKLYYRLHVWNKIGECFSNTVYLNVTETQQTTNKKYSTMVNRTGAVSKCEQREDRYKVKNALPREHVFRRRHALRRRPYAIYMDQSRWKTASSVSIGSLPADQKCILYSLLGYDENKISWSDSEQWLSTLNDIRETLFDAGSVSKRDTEKDIDELMRMNLVQNNRQCLRIPSTDCAEDVMYQLWESTNSKFKRNDSYMLTLWCVTIVRKYCRTVDHILKSEKVIECRNFLSPLLVYRLQMDILTHPTIENRAVRDAAYWILNVPRENLQSLETGTNMYTDLRSKIDKGDVRKLGAVSWTRMIRGSVWVDMIYELRPQCARSTLGQRDHNDIFIMEGDMYALKDEFHVNGNIEDLYAVLLSDRFSVPFDTRYIFYGITEKTGDIVRFVSDRVRHQVMYSYIVSKLLTDDDMKYFIKKASSDCLVEYGRLWRYEREEGEPCLFIPQDLEKMYLEKIGYAALKHVLFHDNSLKETTWKDIIEKYGIPFDLCIQNQNFRSQFVEFVNDERKKEENNAQPLKYMYSAFLFNKDGCKLKDFLRHFNGNMEDLYAILLSDRFSVPFDTRYIFDGITEKTGDIVRFVSDTVRHQVMYSYIVSKLLTDDDMKNFINDASADCLVEYGRLWRYKREEEEPCMFIPHDMEKLYIEKIGYAALKHVQFLEQETPWTDIKEKYDIPFDLCLQSQDFRNRFVAYVHDERKRQGDHVHLLKYMYSAFLFNNKDGCNSTEFFIGVLSNDIAPWVQDLQSRTWHSRAVDSEFCSTGENHLSHTNVLRHFNGNIEDLYAVLLSDRFSVYFDTRYIFDGITEKTGNIVRFVSDTVRHQVMYSYIVSKLLTDDDMKNFINDASADCLVEYGRLWCYRREEEEPCLFIPQDMEKIYIEKIGYAALKHVQFLEPKTPWKDIKEKYDIPFDLCLQSQDFRNRFVEYMHDERKRQGDHVHLLKYMYSAFLFTKDGCRSTDFLGHFNGNMEDLYAVLLSDRFSVPFDTRYIFDGITEKTGDIVRFVSDTVRHQVMYSYIVSKLLTDDDMKNFINDASADCLVEYGRLWRYKREGEEPCLFIPQDMENLYIEKIGYAALKHVQFLEQETPWTDIKEKCDIPFDLCLQSQDLRTRFVEYVHDERKRQEYHVHRLKYMYSAFLLNKDGCKSTVFLRHFNGNIEDLYAVLLSDRFSVPFDTRYIFDGITEKTGDIVRFVSDTVRHQVMYSYIVSKLLTDDDMKNFINDASSDCLVEYGRLWCYAREEEEPCLFIPQDMEKIYIEKIGYAALKHVQFLEQGAPWTDIKKNYDIPFDLCLQSQDFRSRFVAYVHDERKRQGDHVHLLKYMYSAFLFNKDGCKTTERITESNWPILLTILTSSGYKIERPSNAPSRSMPKVAKEFLTNSEINFNQSFNRIKSEKSVFKVKGKNITFASSEMKHVVMSKFVATCLKSDEDFKTYIEKSSPDSLMEYCRLWTYKRDGGEACVFLPPKFIDDYINRLNIDVITHVMVEDRTDSDGKERYRHTRKKISKLLDIPMEVMSWEINSRRRYAERIKLEDKKKMYRARGMIVGCTGAGKTTLLRRLQRKRTSDTQQPMETTKGLEIHEHMFQIQSGALEDHEDKPTDFHSNKQLISMTDFAGQAAYYACHQVYLSRRAFYLLLVDMSKLLDEEAHEHNRERHDPVGSLFHHWTYRDYFTFWLQCIKTYCEVGDRHTADDIERWDRENPVILVASHKDECKSNTSTASDFFQELRGSLPQNQTLEHLLSPDRYLEVECPSGLLSPQQEDMIENVRKSIVQTVENLYHWGEQIPLSWASFEDVLNEKKERRILRRSMLKGLKPLKSLAKSEINDMLRFFHDIGRIIYFADEKLRDVIIIDVQWFVDGFKNIITDQKHFTPGILANDKMMKSGRITELTLRRIWQKENEKEYVPHMDDLLPYMDILGLMVEIKTQKRRSPAGKTFYIPSMNTVDVRDVHFNTINAGQKTSILLFLFKTYLPHFFFFRLVVHCFKKWDALSQDMFCKNAAFFKDKDQCIAIAVNKTSIQLQVFTRSKSVNLKTKRVMKIRKKVERIIREITQTFHKQVTYEIGYSCKDIKITDEDQDDFLLEGDIFPVKRGISETKCPRHVQVDESHDINTQDLLRFWNK